MQNFQSVYAGSQEIRSIPQEGKEMVTSQFPLIAWRVLNTGRTVKINWFDRGRVALLSSLEGFW